MEHRGGHFLVRCECGAILTQCRCPGPKAERLSRAPCSCAAPKKATPQRLYPTEAMTAVETALLSVRVWSKLEHGQEPTKEDHDRVERFVYDDMIALGPEVTPHPLATKLCRHSWVAAVEVLDRHTRRGVIHYPDWP